MKRLCVFVTYDCENIVDDYIGYMLRELRQSVDYLVVVCNYECIAKGIENIKSYADEIFYRKNVGFDAGAYKDAICMYLGWGKVQKFDELLLVNDSFYGPLYSIGDLFDRMEKQDADYWGLSRCPAGTFQDKNSYDSHIQSFFLAFRKTVLQNTEFMDFWEKIKYPKTLHEAVTMFELGCNKLLSCLGFKGIALSDLCQLKKPFKENELPYMLYPLEMVRDVGIPVIKRKCLYLDNPGFGNALETLRYIANTENYDISLIRNHMMRVSRTVKNSGMINYEKLDKFYYSHSRIYFYGAGIYGQNLAVYFISKGWAFEGFLVTSTQGQLVPCIAFDEVGIESGDGIIISVGCKETLLEILNKIKKTCSKSQILCPNYDI